MEALVVVHLSSLDSYYATERDAGGDGGLAWGLAGELASAVTHHEGPVIVVDQGWPADSRESRPRRDVLDAIARRRPELGPLVTMRFDEDDQPWPPFLRRLKARLASLGATSAVVGGIWFAHDLRLGCATEVYLYLKKHMPTRVGEDLVGCESDIEFDEDEE